MKGEKSVVPIAETEIDEIDQVINLPEVDPKDIVITKDDLQKNWIAYAEKEKGNQRIYNALISHKPELGLKGQIILKLTTEVQKEYFTFKVKPGLTRFLKENLANVEYAFEINLSSNGNTPRKVYTDEDKLNFLMEKNPELEIMRNVFKLDFDS